MSESWPGKTDNWQNVLCSYDPICAQIMAIKTWYYQNWDRYMCGFLITSTTSDCAIVEKYVSKHVNLVISGAVKTLVECNWVTSVQRCQHWAQSLATCFPICLCAWVRPAPCAAIGEAKTQTHTHTQGASDCGTETASRKNGVHSVPSSSRQQRLERKFDWFDDNLCWYQLGDQSLTHQGLYSCF